MAERVEVELPRTDELPTVRSADVIRQDLEQIRPSDEAIEVLIFAIVHADDGVLAGVLTEQLDHLQNIVEWISYLRNESVRNMRANGATYDDVAEVLSISKTRAAQLCRRLATGPWMTPVQRSPGWQQGCK